MGFSNECEANKKCIQKEANKFRQMHKGCNDEEKTDDLPKDWQV